MTDAEFNSLIDALKQKALGNVIENVVETYKKNEDGDLVLDNKTLKKIKNEIDTQACIKLIDIELKRREMERNNNDFEKMSDEELELKKQELIRELKLELREELEEDDK